MARFLCDTCKYDHPNACSNPERPNATKCRDYKSSGGAGPGGFGSLAGQWTVKKVFFLLIALIVIIGIILLFVLPY